MSHSTSSAAHQPRTRCDLSRRKKRPYSSPQMRQTPERRVMQGTSPHPQLSCPASSSIASCQSVGRVRGLDGFFIQAVLQGLVHKTQLNVMELQRQPRPLHKYRPTIAASLHSRRKISTHRDDTIATRKSDLINLRQQKSHFQGHAIPVKRSKKRWDQR